MSAFAAFLASLPADRVLVCFAACLATVMLAVGELFATIFFPEPEVSDGRDE